MKTCELTGTALDLAVALAEGKANDCELHAGNVWYGRASSGFTLYSPTNNWEQGGAIIEREGIEIKKGNPLYFPQGNEKGDYYEPLWLAGKQQGKTPLIAAMRCYVAMKLGHEVELPVQLIQER